jgi:hypothetical protein
MSTISLLRLRSFTLKGPRLGLSGLVNEIPWLGLTQLKLQLGDTTMDEWATFLSQCLRMEDLTLIMPSQLTNESRAGIFLPNLGSLALRCPSDMGNVVKNFTLPALYKLEYENTIWKEFEAQSPNYSSTRSMSNELVGLLRDPNDLNNNSTTSPRLTKFALESVEFKRRMVYWKLEEWLAGYDREMETNSWQVTWELTVSWSEFHSSRIDIPMIYTDHTQTYFYNV